MEAGHSEAIFRQPEHQYLKALLQAVPQFDMKPDERLVSLRDDPDQQVVTSEKERRPQLTRLKHHNSLSRTLPSLMRLRRHPAGSEAVEPIA